MIPLIAIAIQRTTKLIKSPAQISEIIEPIKANDDTANKYCRCTYYVPYVCLHFCMQGPALRRSRCKSLPLKVQWNDQVPWVFAELNHSMPEKNTKNIY